LSISPDGSRVAFAGLALNSQIWSQRIARDGTPAGPANALTDDRSRRNSLPVISPDGARLAYMSSRQGERANVWMMDVDGRNPVQLTSGNAFESQPEWFPDSLRVAYQSKSPEDDGLRAIDVTTRMDEKLVDFGVLQHRSSSKTGAVQLCELRLSRSMAQIAFSVQVPPADRARSVRDGAQCHSAASAHGCCPIGRLSRVVSRRALHGRSKSRMAARHKPGSSMPSRERCGG
jgi:dipeptidyl aminopeptidase/acylaminoacyl peptidase